MVSPFFRSGGRPRTAHIYIPPKAPFDKGGLVARPCLALLRNSNSCLQRVQQSVRNFDMVSYYNRRTSNVSPVFRSGGGLMSSVISTGHPISVETPEKRWG